MREYDPVIGRWMVPDPMREFFSPYVAMGNDPVNTTDASRGCTGDCPPELRYNDEGAYYVMQEVVVSAGAAQYRTSNYAFDADFSEIDWNGSYEKYQQMFPQFSGISHADAPSFWNSNYREAYAQLWAEKAKAERDREVVDLLTFWGTGLAYTWGAGYSAPRLSTFRSFNYSPRVARLNVEDVMLNPNMLQGKTPYNISLRHPRGWRIETLGKGSKAGQGFTFREYTIRGNPTGRMLRYHPGGGHKGPRPYWRVGGYNTVSPPIFTY